MPRVVLGYDASPAAAGALQVAAELRRLLRARLSVVSAYPSGALPPPILTGFEKRTREQAERDLDRAELLLDGADDRAAVCDLTASDALRAYAADASADLLVVGRTRHPFRYVHNSPCAVALVPATWIPRPLQRIAVGCDGPAHSADAVALARRLALGVDAIDLVVVEDREDGLHLEPRDPGLVVREPSLAADWACELADRPFGAIRPAYRHRNGDPAQELIAHSETVDLLILGSRGYGPLRRLVFGSVSARVAEHARCPVIVVPPGPAPVDRRRRLESAGYR